MTFRGTEGKPEQQHSHLQHEHIMILPLGALCSRELCCVNWVLVQALILAASSLVNYAENATSSC